MPHFLTYEGYETLYRAKVREIHSDIARQHRYLTETLTEDPSGDCFWAMAMYHRGRILNLQDDLMHTDYQADNFRRLAQQRDHRQTFAERRDS